MTDVILRQFLTREVCLFSNDSSNGKQVLHMAFSVGCLRLHPDKKKKNVLIPTNEMWILWLVAV